MQVNQIKQQLDYSATNNLVGRFNLSSHDVAKVPLNQLTLAHKQLTHEVEQVKKVIVFPRR